jgi:amino acid transporter
LFGNSKGGMRKLRMIPLLAATYFMVSGGPYGLEDVVGFGGYRFALLVLFFLPFFWSFPTALMLGELAAAIPDEGGFYAWVRRALGPFWGFQEAWLSLAASVFDMAIYPTTFVLYLGRIAPALTAGHRAVWLELLVIGSALAWNLRGANAVGEGSVRLWFVALSPYFVLIALAVYLGVKGIHGPYGGHVSMAPPATRDFATAFLVAMWNYMGWDNATTIAHEVDNPQHDYPRVMLTAALMVMLTYIIPIAAVAFAGMPAEMFRTGAWVDAGRIVGGAMLAGAIVIAGALDNFGTFSNLTLSYTRLPHALAVDGYLPQVFTRRLKNGAPWVAILACGTCWALALGLTFERLITLDLLLWGMSIVLEFLALVVLRWKEPTLVRPFRIPGPAWVPVLLGLLPTGLVMVALYLARDEQAAGMSALAFSLLIAAGGVPLYGLALLNKSRRAKAEVPA